FLRATELGVEISRQKEIVLLLRIHKGNISRDITSSKKYLAKVLKASIERRRKLNNGNVNNLSLWSWT
ncbi:MAG: hypothetical protein ACRENO_10455, partial [Thermodesulfobacteriota bacterium]